jgi:hypothetical protein
MGLYLLSTHTASTSSTLNITSGINSTYNEYQIRFVNLHPGTDSAYPRFKPSINGGTDYGVATTTTYVREDVEEAAGTGGAFAYITDYDSAESTGEIQLAEDTGADNDQSFSGVMTLYGPSSTTYVKHFIVETHGSNGGNISCSQWIGGYVNTTSAVNALSFFFSSGNIDTGTIYLYGVG